MEEWLAAEDHGCEHGTQRPHVERVVILLVVDEQLRALEVAGGDADVVLGAGVVKFSETPINQTELSVSVMLHKFERVACSPSASRGRS